MKVLKLIAVMVVSMTTLLGNDSADSYETICKQGIEIWTTLDLVRAISIADNDKLQLAHELVNVFLDYYGLIKQWFSSIDMQQHDAQNNIAHLILLLDYMRDALGDIYRVSTNDDLVSINVILGKIEELCCR